MQIDSSLKTKSNLRHDTRETAGNEEAELRPRIARGAREDIFNLLT